MEEILHVLPPRVLQICSIPTKTQLSNFLGTPGEDYFKGNPKSLNFYFLVIWWGKCCCFNVVRLANTGSWVCLAYWALGFGDSLTKNMKIDGANELEMMMMMMMMMMLMIFPTTKREAPGTSEKKNGLNWQFGRFLWVLIDFEWEDDLNDLLKICWETSWGLYGIWSPESLPKFRPSEILYCW